MKKIELIAPEKKFDIYRTGKGYAKGDTRMLNLVDFLDKKKADRIVPEASSFWKRRAKFPIRSFGNTEAGSCTRSSQAQKALRLERLEQRRTIDITDDEVLRVYFEMTDRYYGGGDTGAYELDAMNDWRREDRTFHDTKGRPYIIEAFTRVNHMNIDEVKSAIWLGGSHGVKICLNLPWAWTSNLHTWDIPAGMQPVGNYRPGTWGGHSMYANDYDQNWIYGPHTWGVADWKMSWKAFSIYCDESYLAIDSFNAWKKKPVAKLIDLSNLKAEVNKVSSLAV